MLFFVNRFNEIFDGVLLAHEVMDIPSRHGEILNGLFPYVGVRLTARLLLFAPKPDTYLGMLIASNFNYPSNCCASLDGCGVF